jgi:DNA-binding transcriptional MerR regulator
MNQLLSTRTVAALTGASIRQIDYWARTSLLKPSGKDAAGKGSRRRYTFADIVAIMTIRQLRERGCPLQKVRVAIRYLRQHFPSDSGSRELARLTLLTDGRDVYMLSDRDRVMQVVTRQHVWSVALGLLIQNAEEQFRRLPSEMIQSVRIGGRDYHLNVIHDPDSGTYSVQCRELPGAISEGDTLPAAVSNGKAAIRAALAFIDRHKRAGRHVKVG